LLILKAMLDRMLPGCQTSVCSGIKNSFVGSWRESFGVGFGQ
jgi:hypothetical protein